MRRSAASYLIVSAIVSTSITSYGLRLRFSRWVIFLLVFFFELVFDLHCFRCSFFEHGKFFCLTFILGLIGVSLFGLDLDPGGLECRFVQRYGEDESLGCAVFCGVDDVRELCAV